MIQFNKKTRKQATVNAGSMADIAFLLLIFFLVSTSIFDEKGIKVKLPEKQDNDIVTPISDRNVLSLLINYNGELLMEGEQFPLRMLKSKVKEFVLNTHKLTSLPKSPLKAIILLRHDKATPYQAYISTYAIIRDAYSDMRNHIANQKYKVLFEELPLAKKKEIASLIPMNISEIEPSDYSKQKI